MSSEMLNLASNPAPAALIHSFLMIIVSELGDKTFLIAALLSMRASHTRWAVFSGAFGALALMSLLSACMGHLLPFLLLPARWTHGAAAVLFAVFGVKMASEARAMEGDGGGKMEEEMREAEEEIEEDEGEVEGKGADEGGEDGGRRPTVSRKRLEDMEKGESVSVGMDMDGGDNDGGLTATIPATPPEVGKTKSKKHYAGKRSLKEGFRNFCSFFLGPVFVQAFVLTFLGEWGDRSQIATIALGAAHNMYLVTIGTVLGHACCTALAVIGGRYVSSKISVKHVTAGGAFLFLVFSVIYFYETFMMSSSDVEMAIPLE